MTAQATLLPGNRLHLHHGPIDLICQAWGTPPAIAQAYQAAAALFPTILPALCAERPHLSQPLPTPTPTHPIAQAMHQACTRMSAAQHPPIPNEPGPITQSPFSSVSSVSLWFPLPTATPALTPMAAVAGAVADHILQAMTQAAPLQKAYVNNGGDIAYHLAQGHHLDCALIPALADPRIAGTLHLTHHAPARGLATSGRACKGQGGRSFSLGIADAVTILAPTAAQADAAATLVANAVDLPGHPAIHRRPAHTIDPDSDLRDIPITWHLGPLTPAETHRALEAGRRTAAFLQAHNLIHAAILALNGQLLTTPLPQRTLAA